MTETPVPDEQVDWDGLLSFLPVLDQPEFEVGEVVSGDGTEGGTLTFPYWNYEPQVSRFIQAVYDTGAILWGFDWPAWQEHAVRYVEQPGYLAGADLDICRRLLTTHVRKDRFVDGHVGAMIESGHIVAVLKRIEQILPDGETGTPE